jgi:hypothetical protein
MASTSHTSRTSAGPTWVQQGNWGGSKAEVVMTYIVGVAAVEVVGEDVTMDGPRYCSGRDTHEKR